MITSADLKDPLEFARLVQTIPELQRLIEPLMKFRRLLMEENIRELNFMLLGFNIEYIP